MEFFNYFNLTLIASALLIGVLIGVKIFTYKKGDIFTPEQLKIILEIRSYANVVVNELKGQFNGENELKAKVVQMVATEFPNINKTLIQTAVDFIFSQTEKLLEDSQTN